MFVLSGCEFHQRPTHPKLGQITAADLYVTHPKTLRLVRFAHFIPVQRLRDSFITSTNFPKIIGWDKRISGRALLHIKIGKHVSNGNEHTRRGIEYEETAFNLFDKQQRSKGRPCFRFNGYVCSNLFSFLAASPDGITCDGCLIEIKCPLKFYETPPRQHWAQMQFDMYVTETERAYYIQYCDGEIRVSVVEAETGFILGYIDTLVSFYSILDQIASYGGLE